MNRFLLMNDRDNVAVALVDLPAGERMEIRRPEGNSEFELLEAIPFGHKFALRLLTRGEEVIKYGQVIGLATRTIEVGHHVHVHNVESIRARGDKS